MTIDPIEVIREALLGCQHVMGMDVNGVEYRHENTDVTQALAALETVRSNYVPLELLPEGWVLLAIENDVHGDYVVNLFNCTPNVLFDKSDIYGTGITPNAAFLAAVKQIGDV